MHRRFLFTQILIIYYLFGFWYSGKSQTPSPGHPYIENYLTEETLVSTENRTVIQDSSGIIYIGNSLGVIQFDGKVWDSIQVENKSRVRSLAIGDDQKLYVGAQNELGYIENRNGSSQYYSLKHRIPLEEQIFDDVWNIHPINEQIFFHTNSKIFIWNGKDFKIIKPFKKFHFSTHAIGETLYVYEEGLGLFAINDHMKQRVPNGEFIAYNQVHGIVPYQNDKLLIYGLHKGLLIYEDGKFQAVKPETNRLLLKSQVYEIIKLSNRGYALATIQNGVIILNEALEVVQVINKQAGLYSDHVNSVYEDKKGNIWAATENSVSVIHLNNLFTKIDYRQGLSEMVLSAAYFNNCLYIGTSQGLFKTNSQDFWKKQNKFELINPEWHVWNLQVIGEDLIIGNNEGTYQFNGNKFAPIDEAGGGWKVLEREGDKNHLILGSYFGAYLLGKENKQWQLKSQFSGIEESFRIFEEDTNNKIWMLHPNIGLFCFYATKDHRELKKLHFIPYTEKKTTQGSTDLNNSHRSPESETLTFGKVVHIAKIKDTLRFITQDNFLLFDYSSKTFIEDPALNDYREKGMIKAKEDENGNLWILLKEKIVLKRKTGNGYDRVGKRFVLPEKLIPGFELIYNLNDSILLLGTQNGALLLNHERSEKSFSPNIFLSTVYTFGKNNKVLQNNHFTTSKTTISNLQDNILNYSQNNIHFDFSSPSYEIKSPEFSYQLAGFDEDWSEYTNTNFKEYTNLPERDYTFRIKARDNTGKESEIILYNFKILPPWYRTSWAYLVYFILIILIILFLAKLYIIRIKMLKKKHLQKLRQQRTAAFLLIQQQKLAQQNKELINQVIGLNRQRETLDALKEELATIAEEHPEISKVAGLAKSIKKKIVEEDDWKKFEAYFDQVHNNFLSKFKQHNPQITSNDLRLCAYIRMNLSSKEIAAMLNLSHRGIETSRYRLRKKLNLAHEQDLNDFILSFK